MRLHWLIQDNLFREGGYGRLLTALDRLGSRYSVVTVLPFIEKILPLTDFMLLGRDEPEVQPDGPEVEIDLCQPVFALGSYKLARLTRARDCFPGAFFEGLTYPEWVEGWAGLILNPDAWIGKVKYATVKGRAFIRPTTDSKTFSGAVFEEAEFEKWKARALMSFPEDYVHGDVEIMVSSPKTIYSETRFWIVRGKVVTASTYRVGRNVVYSDQVDAAVLAFAQAAANKWGPNPAYVMDVAETPDGLKIVEANCLNAAGFYAADMQKLVAAIEDAFGGKA